jgi:pimeloyl-ACP methyl ester carboxylesterase
MKSKLGWFFVMVALSQSAYSEEDLGEHRYADSEGVKIHYVEKGEGKPVVLLHGFPDYWYTWRNQIPALSERFRTAALDLRGYNLSDQPEGVEAYQMKYLVEDVGAVIRDMGEEKAVIVGHDWGGAIAWAFAMRHPEMTERLVVLNLPHPKGLSRELANNPEQQANSQYARDFQKPDAASKITPEGLAFWVRSKEAKEKYIEAFKRSSLEGMLNFYKANYPKAPYTYDEERPYPPVDCPVLMFHGLKDKYLLSGALSGTWSWVSKDLTLVTIPEADHFVQHDAAELVTKRMLAWLLE